MLHGTRHSTLRYMMNEMNSYMFDTNAINQLIKDEIDIEKLDQSHKYFITSVQMIELSATKNERTRQKLLDGFKVIEIELPVNKTNAETALWGSFGWGEMGWGQSGGHYERIKDKLDKYPRKKNDRGNPSDALIIEACLMQKHALISNEKAVQAICHEEGVTCMPLDEFLERT